MIPELDRWLPRHSIRVTHHRTAQADAARLWDAAAALRLDEVPVLGRLVQWRIPGTPPTTDFQTLLSSDPFLVLQREEGLMVSGMVGRIWTPRRNYPHLEDPDAYLAWNRGGTARVGIAVRVRAAGAGAEIHTDARVEAIGTQGRLGVAALRPVVVAFEHLLGSEALRAAVRDAERQGGENPGAAGSGVLT